MGGLYADDDLKKLIDSHAQTLATVAVAVNDIKNIFDSQSQISANVAIATTNIAVATTNITWIIKTYGEQCTTITTMERKIEDQKAEIGNLKAEFWKYIGIGIGASATISAFIALLPFIARALGS